MAEIRISTWRRHNRGFRIAETVRSKNSFRSVKNIENWKVESRVVHPSPTLLTQSTRYWNSMTGDNVNILVNRNYENRVNWTGLWKHIEGTCAKTNQSTLWWRSVWFRRHSHSRLVTSNERHRGNFLWALSTRILGWKTILKYYVVLNQSKYFWCRACNHATVFDVRKGKYWVTMRDHVNEELLVQLKKIPRCRKHYYQPT